MEAWRGHCPLCPFKKRATGGELPFHNSILGFQFHDLPRWTWNKFVAAIRPPKKFRMVFYNFCCYFWGQHCWWTETNTICNDFLITFHCIQLFTALPAPPQTSVPEYECCVNKIRRNVGLQTWICHQIEPSQTLYIQWQRPPHASA